METERTTVLPADVDEVRRALLEPELLSAWLGRWTPHDDDTATVTTDDGVDRRVSGHRIDDDGSVRWRWAPVDRPDEHSEVVVHLEAVDPDRTALVVREIRGISAPQGATASLAGSCAFGSASARWTGCLLALGAVLAARQLVGV